MRNDRWMVRFRGQDCWIGWAQYSNDRRAIQLMTMVDGVYEEPVTRATVNIPEHHLNEDEVAIKDWSENEGMVEALVEAGVIHPPHRHIQSGYVQVPIARWRKDEHNNWPWEQ